ncbi:class A beta-lactamase [Dyella humicola]|uniref:class A beta-lactamase n=1 Tax=Dyella humicola TaxID=2992126 RepID=UPI00224E5BF9|nr:class A beta-lactamase [Dyella humicola]
MKMSRVRAPAIAGCLLNLALACLSPSVEAFEQPSTAVAQTDLQHTLEALAQRARPGLLGIAVLDLQSGNAWRVNADHAYPMMSMFKAPVAAAVLSRVERGELTLGQQVTIKRAEVMRGSAVPSIGARFQGEEMTFTVDQLLTAAVSESDNTAVDALIRVVGGPQVVTSFLHAHGIDGMRVDLDEAGLRRVFSGLVQGEAVPTNESPEATDARYERGFQAFMADPRNRSTPDAAVTFLSKLWRNELLPPKSTQHLLRLMYAQTIPNRLRAGLPKDVRFADKTGTSGSFDGEVGAYNDIGILTWPDGHTVIVAAFLSGSRASDAERDALFAELGRRIAAAFQR